MKLAVFADPETLLRLVRFSRFEFSIIIISFQMIIVNSKANLTNVFLHFEMCEGVSLIGQTIANEIGTGEVSNLCQSHIRPHPNQQKRYVKIPQRGSTN